MVAVAENSRLGQNFFDAGSRQVEHDVTAYLHRDSGRCWVRRAAECTQDPMGFAAGDTNLSRYVNNSPTNATDPSGLQQRSDLYDERHAAADRQRQDAEAEWNRALSLATNPTARKEILEVLQSAQQGAWAGGFPYSAATAIAAPFSQRANDRFNGIGAGPCSAWAAYALETKLFGRNEKRCYVNVQHVTFDIHGMMGGLWANHHAFRVEVYDKPQDTRTALGVGFRDSGPAKVFYIDNGWLGGPDHVFFNVPSHYYNEQQSIMGNGQKTPGPGPAPPPPPSPPSPPGWTPGDGYGSPFGGI